MSTTPHTSQVEQQALQRAMESNFEIMTVDIDKLQEEESDLVWSDEMEDFWAYKKGFD